MHERQEKKENTKVPKKKWIKKRGVNLHDVAQVLIYGAALK